MLLPSGIHVHSCARSAMNPQLVLRFPVLVQTGEFLCECGHSPLLEGGGRWEDKTAGSFLIRLPLPLPEVRDHFHGIRTVAHRQRCNERVTDGEESDEAGEEDVDLHSERNVHLFCTEF